MIGKNSSFTLVFRTISGQSRQEVLLSMVSATEEDEKGCFFSATDPVEEVVPKFGFEPQTSEPRVVHFKHARRPEPDAMCKFDLNLAQDRHLTFDRTESYAMVLCDSIGKWALLVRTHCQPDGEYVSVLRPLDQALHGPSGRCG